MADEIRILGPDGLPIRKQELTKEIASAQLTGVRQIWQTHTIASGLTPERLAALLRNAAEGNQRDFLILAEEMEERDLHYSSVLGTRKRAVSGIEPTVEAASDEAGDKKLADEVRELIRRPEFGEALDDCLDALGKGYSAVEIMWKRGRKWMPQEYIWRDPGFFVFDRNDGTTLRLLDEADSYNGIALPPYKFIIHKPRIKSGLPVRNGLARLVTISYMCKAYTLTDWVAFAEVFGMPLRLGRYGPNATPEDIQTLVNAVANLGTDAAAVMPDSMRVDFQEAGNRSDGASLFEGLAEYLDKQVSKAVLGQTATTEGTPGKLGGEDAQSDVRQDILSSDARQLQNTLNRDLVKPFIDLNFGPQENYPRLCLPVTEPEDIAAFTASLKDLVPLGLQVEQSVVRDRLGIPDPAKGADILQPPSNVAFNRALNRISNEIPDAVETLADEFTDDWEEQLAPLTNPIQQLANEVADEEEFRRRLPELLEQMDAGELIQQLSRANFQARGLGDTTDNIEV